MHEHARWVEAIASREDRAAFAALFQHFAPRIKSYLLQGGAPPEQVEEIIQEVMLTVWRKAAGYNPQKAAVSTWIFTIARNLRIDRIRRAKRMEPEPEDLDQRPQTDPAPDALAELSQRQDRLQEALAGLPPEQALVLQRAYFDGISLRAIAEELGVPEGTIKSRVRLAMQHLRAAMTTEDR